MMDLDGRAKLITNHNFKDQTDLTRISRTKLIANPNLDGLKCMLAIGFFYLPPSGLDLDSAYCSFQASRVLCIGIWVLYFVLVV